MYPFRRAGVSGTITDKASYWILTWKRILYRELYILVHCLFSNNICVRFIHWCNPLSEQIVNSYFFGSKCLIPNTMKYATIFLVGLPFTGLIYIWENKIIPIRLSPNFIPITAAWQVFVTKRELASQKSLSDFPWLRNDLNLQSPVTPVLDDTGGKI